MHATEFPLLSVGQIGLLTARFPPEAGGGLIEGGPGTSCAGEAVIGVDEIPGDASLLGRLALGVWVLPIGGTARVSDERCRHGGVCGQFGPLAGQLPVHVRLSEGQHYRMARLNLLAAIVIRWNAVHLSKAARQRKYAGLTAEPDILAHISPLG